MVATLEVSHLVFAAGQKMTGWRDCFGLLRAVSFASMHGLNA